MESATLMQDQGERLLDLILKQGVTGYEEGKKALGEWTVNYKKASEQFKSSVEENLTKLEEFLSKK
jgi:polyhydroxyalkanoate synthesis regulator phasin